MDLDTYAPNKVLAPHPDPFHIYTRAELDAYEAAARHLWAIHKLFCDVPICAEQRRPQLTRHAYPGQPSTRAEHVVQPCCCRYLVVNAEALGGDLVLDGPSGYHVLTLRAPIASLFLITPNCPHHGHLANAHLIERLWSDPYLNGILRDPYDMDDDERR